MIHSSQARRALEQIRTHLSSSPLVYSEHFSRRCGAQVYLKLENLQRTGSFKARGALHKIGSCRARIGERGVVAASAGNHAQGVALAAATLGVPATIVMPEGAPLSKQVATRHYGGRVVLHGATVTEALEVARDLARGGALLIHPFDDEVVIAGQATVGLEMLEQAPALDEVWIPVGGGGLIAGVATVLRDAWPRLRVVGIEAAACPSAQAALRAGRPVEVPPGRTIADGIRVAKVGAANFPYLRERVDELRAVDEDQIAGAVVELLERKKLLAEGAGAVTVAALLAAPPETVAGRRIGLIISGGNLDLNMLDRILERGLMRSRRILRLGLVLDDAPGALAAVLEKLSRERANILRISHDRLSARLPIDRTRVRIWLETRGPEHAARIERFLEGAGYELDP